MSDFQFIDPLEKHGHQTPPWCPLPWVHLAIDVDGSFRVCCISAQSKKVGTNKNSNGKFQSIILKNTGEKFNVKVDRLDEVLKSDFLAKVRLENETSNRSASCQICVYRSELDLQNKQKYEKKWWSHISITEPKLKYLDIRSSFLCNLKCAMCGPSASSSWVGEINKIFALGPIVSDSLKHTLAAQKRTGDLASTESWLTPDSVVWADIMGRSKEIEQIYFAGGEPLIDPYHEQFLTEFLSRGVNPRLLIRYNTNLTKVSGPLIELWRKLPKLQLSVSLDGAHEVCEYVRYPLKFKRVAENLELILKELPNADLPITYTVQMLNVFHINEFVHWLEQFFKQQNKLHKVSLNPLIYPEYLSVCHLPDQMKAEYLKMPDPYQILQPIKNLVSEPRDEKMWQAFVEYTQILDKIRPTRFLDTFPEFRPYFDSQVSTSRLKENFSAVDNLSVLE